MENWGIFICKNVLKDLQRELHMSYFWDFSANELVMGAVRDMWSGKGDCEFSELFELAGNHNELDGKFLLNER